MRCVARTRDAKQSHCGSSAACGFLRGATWCDERQCRKSTASLQQFYDFAACVRAEVKEAATQLEVRVRHRFRAGVVSGGWLFGMGGEGNGMGVGAAGARHMSPGMARYALNCIAAFLGRQHGCVLVPPLCNCVGPCSANPHGLPPCSVGTLGTGLSLTLTLFALHTVEERPRPQQSPLSWCAMMRC